MNEFYFPNWVNKFTILIVVSGLAVGGYLATCFYVAIHPYNVNIGHEPRQPVPFSHALHAGQLKLDCRYCHNTVEVAGHAAIPPTSTCGNCHGANRVVEGVTLGVVHPESDLLEPVRTSLDTNEPVEWLRVHELPDFVYFNHSIHITKGISCVTCHGRIDKMDVVKQVKPLSMKWCLECHRDPTEHIRDPELVTDLGFKPEDAEAYAKKWAEELQVNPKINCSTCHR